MCDNIINGTNKVCECIFIGFSSLTDVVQSIVKVSELLSSVQKYSEKMEIEYFRSIQMTAEMNWTRIARISGPVEPTVSRINRAVH